MIARRLNKKDIVGSILNKGANIDKINKDKKICFNDITRFEQIV